MKNQDTFNSIIEAAKYYFTKQMGDWKECLILACKREKVTAKLKAGRLSFSFRKGNGEIRPAIGTLSSDLFSYKTKGEARKYNPDVIAYYDLKVEAFRAFRIERLLEVA